MKHITIILLIPLEHTSMGKMIDENQPRVCVCIPVRNGASTIKCTLASIVSQDYSNISIMICDNNSTDNTKQIVDSFAAESGFPITYILNENLCSAEQNWNYALSQLHFKFDFYALYHADDLYTKTMISEQVKMMMEYSVGAVFCTARLIDESGTDISESHHHSGKLPDEITEKVFDYQTLFRYTLKYYNFVKAPSFFFDGKILADNFLFDPKFKSSADLDMWLRIAEKYKIAVINKPLLLYRISKNQGTYTLALGKETEADYFTVMDHHLKKNNVDQNLLFWYRSYKGINMITRATNLCKHNKPQEALDLLKQAVNLKNIPYLLKISHGIRNFLLGFALRIAIPLNLEKKLITLIKR